MIHIAYRVDGIVGTDDLGTFKFTPYRSFDDVPEADKEAIAVLDAALTESVIYIRGIGSKRQYKLVDTCAYILDK